MTMSRSRAIQQGPEPEIGGPGIRTGAGIHDGAVTEQQPRPLKAIRVGGRVRRALGDVAGLAASINDVGLLQPIVVDGNGVLIAGLRRLAALKLLGRQDVPVNVVATIDDALSRLKAERDENTQRKDFTPE